MKSKINIAIDGVVASGKGTTAKGVAKRLGYIYLDTGVGYRAIALYCVQNHINIHDPKAIVAALPNIDVQMEADPEGTQILLNGVLVTSELRSMIVNKAVPITSAIPEVRLKLRAIQQDIAAKGGIVMDGRDIGTDVLPNAELKIFMVGDLNTRAQRRKEEYKKKHHEEVSLAEIIENIKYRDDMAYYGPNPTSKRAIDAIDLDTTDLTVEGQIDRVVSRAEQILNPTQ